MLHRLDGTGRIGLGRGMVAALIILTASLLPAGCKTPNKNLGQASDLARSGVDDGAGEADSAVLQVIPETLPYTLAPGDSLAIRVLEDEMLLSDVKIDMDGGFDFMYTGRVQAEGLTTTDVRRKLTRALSELYVDPHVTVNLTSQQQQFVRVLGSAMRPGRIPLRRDMRVMDAIAEAGGPHADAALKRVIVIRRVAEDDIRAGFFNYKDAMYDPLSGALASDILLKRGDTIFLPKSHQAQWESAFRFISRMFDAVVDVERSITLYPDVRDIFATGERAGATTIVVR